MSYLEPREVYDGALIDLESAVDGWPELSQWRLSIIELIENQYLNQVAGYLPEHRPSMADWLYGRAIYSAAGIIHQLQTELGWSETEALEHLGYNIMGIFRADWPIIVEDL